jgi:hypothetical protein
MLISAGCSGEDQQADGSGAAFQGFMVLAPRPVDFGLMAGDTLREMPTARAPAALRQLVESDVRGADYEIGCTRYFGSGSVVVVYVAKSCRGDGRNTHDWGVALFRQEGDRFGREPRIFEDAMGTMCPRERDKRGRPLAQCL